MPNLDVSYIDLCLIVYISLFTPELVLATFAKCGGLTSSSAEAIIQQSLKNKFHPDLPLPHFASSIQQSETIAPQLHQLSHSTYR